MQELLVTEAAEARFWANVAKADGCWLWSASATPNGYGQFRLGRLMVSAHRVAWLMTYGPVPADLCVLHRCDVRRCVRPDHLFLGTTGDNNRDTVAKGRYVSPRKSRTHCRYGHEFDEKNTYWWRGSRICRACKRKGAK